MFLKESIFGKMGKRQFLLLLLLSLFAVVKTIYVLYTLQQKLKFSKMPYIFNHCDIPNDHLIFYNFLYSLARSSFALNPVFSKSHSFFTNIFRNEIIATFVITQAPTTTFCKMPKVSLVSFNVSNNIVKKCPSLK